MLERDIEKKVTEYAKNKGMLGYKFTSPQNRAVCDRIFICNCGVFFVEFKRKGCKPTKAQEKHHQELAKRNVHVYVVDNVNLGKEVIDYEEVNRHHWSTIRYVDSNKVVKRKKQAWSENVGLRM